MAVRGADGSTVQLRPEDPKDASGPDGDMVETASSPRPSLRRPVAPPLDLGSTPAQAAKPSESAELSTSPSPVVNEPATHDETPEQMSRDDISVPPVGLDSAFFDDPLTAEYSEEIDERDTRAALKLTPTVARRRAHLARYVTVTVGLAGALCAAALIKVTAARGHEEHPRLATTSVAAAAAEPALNATTTTEQPSSTMPAPNSVVTDTNGTEGLAIQAQTQPEPPQPAAGSAPTVADHVDTQPGTTPAGSGSAAAPAASHESSGVVPADTSQAASDEPPLDPKEAAKEAAKSKVKARGALEWGKMSDAIAAGEKSVTLDPTDAEAWLILGAAYQEKGDLKNAFRSFRACMDQGKRGPRNECAAMLR